MHRTNIFKAFLALVLLATVFAWGGAGGAQAHGNNGAVYILTNQAAGNGVAAYTRANNGTLTYEGTYSTGGLGTGAGLGSQGALALSYNDKWLFAVNAGSDEITVFSSDPYGVTFVDKVSSGGIRPISLTSHKDVLYVLNAGGSGNITGFNIGGDGHLTPIPGSTRPLSGAATNPAQVQFNSNGRLLAVTEKGTNSIDTYTVNNKGIASGPITTASAGTTPFGFAFGKSGKLIVSEAFGGAPDASAASSYTVAPNGSISVVSASVLTHQTAACWLVLTDNERYAYTTNAGSGSISGYSVGNDGSLSLLNADGRTGVTGDGSNPIDLGLSKNSRFLYALTNGTHGVSAFRVEANGSLTPLPGISGIPAGAVGLAAR
jgi:6-phosphogluconolactonase (cycloisomerase 2 family)